MVARNDPIADASLPRSARDTRELDAMNTMSVAHYADFHHGLVASGLGWVWRDRVRWHEVLRLVEVELRVGLARCHCAGHPR